MKRLVLVLGILLPVQATSAVLSAGPQPYGICTASGCGDPVFDADIFADAWKQAEIARAFRTKAVS